MTPQTFPGALFVDALPTGERVLSYVGRVETHAGSFPVPDGAEYLLFPVCTNVGGFKFSGKDHLGMGGHEWTAAGWRTFGQPLMGEWPIIYDATGTRRTDLIPWGGGISSQGYRNLDASGALIPADATYGVNKIAGDPDFGKFFGLSEWTKLGPNLYIGQGHDTGGVRVWDGATLRTLTEGDCRFVQAHVAGDAVAVSYIRYDGGRRGVIHQMTLGELRALPVYIAPAPPPIVDHPAPTPTPAPTPAPPKPAPTPEPPVTPTQFDPSTVQFVDSPADLASWPETATITSVRFDGDRFAVDFTGRDSWPDLPFGDGKGGTCQYTLGVCCYVNGKWEGAAVVQFWKGRDEAAGGSVSNFAGDWFYDGRWDALKGHQPQPGERVAVFCASGNLRDNDNVPSGANRQRTNFALVTWGQDYTSEASATTPPPASQPSGPTPSPPSSTTETSDMTDAQVQRIVDAIDAASKSEIAKLDELKVHIEAASKQITNALPAVLAALSGGGGLLGGLLKK